MCLKPGSFLVDLRRTSEDLRLGLQALHVFGRTRRTSCCDEEKLRIEAFVRNVGVTWVFKDEMWSCSGPKRTFVPGVAGLQLEYWEFRRIRVFRVWRKDPRNPPGIVDFGVCRDGRNRPSIIGAVLWTTTFEKPGADVRSRKAICERAILSRTSVDDLCNSDRFRADASCEKSRYHLLLFSSNLLVAWTPAWYPPTFFYFLRQSDLI